jgi:hypothetical protein
MRNTNKVETSGASKPTANQTRTPFINSRPAMRWNMFVSQTSEGGTTPALVAVKDCANADLIFEDG